MSNKSITLSESELKNIISESVKNILNELNWRTYDKFANMASDRAVDSKYSKPERKYYSELSNRLKNAKRDRQSKQYDGVNDWNYDEEIRWPDSEIKTSDKTRFDRLYGNVVNGDIRNLSKIKQREGARQIGRYNRNGDEWNNEKKKWVPKDGQK